jgi:subfamily B ATP-binding cassette protein MsbA
VLYAVGHAFVLGYGGYLVFRDAGQYRPDAFTVGGVTAMLVYLGQLWEPIRRMTGFTADVQTNAAACARVFTVLDLEPTVADAPGARPLSLQPRTLNLDDVAFAYHDEDGAARPVFRGVRAEIAPGRMVAFVGPSGSGKSTLLNLLPRFYDPTAGRLCLDGHDLRTIRLADVRAHVALVPQDSPVIAGTIAENIAFGRADATAEQIRRAAALAGADRFIEELEHAYDTPITEGGQNLSGGQRQRLAIARAILTDAPILVLDEPTSGLDPHHEHLVLQTLHQLKRQRTIILVTHTLNAVTECDQIFVLKDGVIAESGTHDELLANNGPYADLARAGRSEGNVVSL